MMLKECGTILFPMTLGVDMTLLSEDLDTMLLRLALGVRNAGGKVGRKKIKTPILEICEHPKFPNSRVLDFYEGAGGLFSADSSY